MASLTNTKISDTYPLLLKIETNGVDGTLRSIEDGDGTTSALKISSGAIQVDNIKIDGNAITSTDSNGNIDLTPNGSGEVNISKVDIDSGAIDGTPIGANSANTGAFTTISASGNVDFNGDLDVDGTTNLDDTDIDGTLTVQGSNYTTLSIQAGSTTHGAILNLGDSGDIDYGSITQFASGAGEGGRMRFIAGTTETMNLRGSSVGIGTSSPSSYDSYYDNLVVYENGNAGIAIIGSTSGETSLGFGDGTGADTYRGAVAYVHTSGSHQDKMFFKTAATNRMVIDSSGRLGVGIISPEEMLEVYNASSPAIQLNDGGDYKSIFRLAGNDLEMRGSSGTIEFFTGDADGDSSTERMRITSGGFVGIQTVDNSGDYTPQTISAPLHVLQKTASQGYGLAIQGNSNTAGARLGIGNANCNFGTRDKVLDIGFDSNTDFIYSRTTQDLIFGVNSSERMRITSDGKFGFGGITPAQKYEFRGDNHNDILRMYDSANSDNIWILRNEVHSGTSSGRLQLLKGDGDGVELNGHDGRTSFIKSPLAIGGTTASEKLTIHNGDILVDSARGVRASGGNEMIRFSDSSGVMINSGGALRTSFKRDGSILHHGTGTNVGMTLYKHTSGTDPNLLFTVALNNAGSLYHLTVCEITIVHIGNANPRAVSKYLWEIENHNSFPSDRPSVESPVLIAGDSQSITVNNPSADTATFQINYQVSGTSNTAAYFRVVSGVTGVSSLT